MPTFRKGTNFAKEMSQLTTLLRRVERQVELPLVWRDAVTGKVNDLIRDLAAAGHNSSAVHVAEK